MLGYLATTFVVGSFFMNGERSIRLINSIGAILFIWYGIILRDNPIIITNSFILIVHMYKVRALRDKKIKFNK